MKKKIALGLALALAASVGTTAFAAAANPFTDVPAKHWSYGAIQQLAKAGIVEGYNDGEFKGDKTITRYEMAVIVAKAMAKEDKADAAQKATIDKLAAEFSSELDNLGVRVSNLEQKVGNIKWDGYARFRAERTPSGSNTANHTSDTVTTNRVRLNITAPLDTDWAFKGRIQYDSTDNTNLGGTANSKDTDSKVNFASAYVTGKAFGLDSISVGRVPVWLGQGFLVDDSGGSSNVSPDGIVIGKNIGVTTLQLGYTRSNDLYNKTRILPGFPTDLTTEFAGFVAPINKNLTFDASYLKDKDNHYYKTTAAGLTYTGIENFTISGEYGKNKADYAKWKNDGDDAKGYQAQIKWQGAQKAKVNTWGLWVAYNKFESGFDPAAFTTVESTSYEDFDRGLKGEEIGVEYVPFKNSIFSVKYENYKTNKPGDKKNGFDQDNKGVIAQLEIFF